MHPPPPPLVVHRSLVAGVINTVAGVFLTVVVVSISLGTGSGGLGTWFVVGCALVLTGVGVQQLIDRRPTLVVDQRGVQGQGAIVPYDELVRFEVGQRGVPAHGFLRMTRLDGSHTELSLSERSVPSRRVGQAIEDNLRWRTARLEERHGE